MPVLLIQLNKLLLLVEEYYRRESETKSYTNIVHLETKNDLSQGTALRDGCILSVRPQKTSAVIVAPFQN